MYPFWLETDVLHVDYANNNYLSKLTPNITHNLILSLRAHTNNIKSVTSEDNQDVRVTDLLIGTSLLVLSLLFRRITFCGHASNHRNTRLGGCLVPTSLPHALLHRILAGCFVVTGSANNDAFLAIVVISRCTYLCSAAYTRNLTITHYYRLTALCFIYGPPLAIVMM